jgi:hypothetical protein
MRLAWIVQQLLVIKEAIRQLPSLHRYVALFSNHAQWR